MADQLVKKGSGKKRKGYKGKWWKPSAATIGTNAMWYGLDPSSYHQFFGALLGLKDGGRVRGVGKAKRGFGRAMRKK